MEKSDARLYKDAIGNFTCKHVRKIGTKNFAICSINNQQFTQEFQSERTIHFLKNVKKLNYYYLLK